MIGSRRRKGDEVFGGCRGALAEYACASAKALIARPADVSVEDAAAIPVAALTALQGLRDRGRLRRRREDLATILMAGGHARGKVIVTAPPRAGQRRSGSEARSASSAAMKE